MVLGTADCRITVGGKFYSNLVEIDNKIMQKTKAGITFIMKESMVEYIENKTVFVLDTIPANDDQSNLILEEQSF